MNRGAQADCRLYKIECACQYSSQTVLLRGMASCPVQPCKAARHSSGPTLPRERQRVFLSECLPRPSIVSLEPRKSPFLVTLSLLAQELRCLEDYLTNLWV